MYWESSTLLQTVTTHKIADGFRCVKNHEDWLCELIGEKRSISCTEEMRCSIQLPLAPRSKAVIMSEEIKVSVLKYLTSWSQEWKRAQPRRRYFIIFWGKNCTTFTIGFEYALTWPWNSSLLHAPPWRKNSLKRAHLPSRRLHCLLRVHGSTMMWISCSHVPIWKKRLIPCSTISNVLLLLITFF